MQMPLDGAIARDLYTPASTCRAWSCTARMVQVTALNRPPTLTQPAPRAACSGPRQATGCVLAVNETGAGVHNVWGPGSFVLRGRIHVFACA